MSLSDELQLKFSQRVISTQEAEIANQKTLIKQLGDKLQKATDRYQRAEEELEDIESRLERETVGRLVASIMQNSDFYKEVLDLEGQGISKDDAIISIAKQLAIKVCKK